MDIKYYIMSTRRTCRGGKLIRPVGRSDEVAVIGIVRVPSVEFDVIKDNMVVLAGNGLCQLGIKRYMLRSF